MRLPLALLVCGSLTAQIQEVFQPKAQSWTVAYDEAERALKAGRYKEALENYRRALELSQNRPGKSVRTYGNNYISYYPYLGMARASLGLGDLVGARSALDKSARMGGEPASEREALERELIRRQPPAAEIHPAALPKIPFKPELVPERKPEPLRIAPLEQRPEAAPKGASALPPPSHAAVPQMTAVKPAPKAVAPASSSVSDALPMKPTPKPGPPIVPRRPVWPWWIGGVALLAGAAGLLHWRRRERNPYGVDLRLPSSGSIHRSSATGASTKEASPPPSEGAFQRNATPTHMGPFRVTEVLGRGGCATTYLGVHERSGLKAALKVPHSHVLADADFRTRFWREAELGRMLDHPRIPKILEAGSEEDPWLALAYVPGITLEEHLKKVRPLPLNQVIHIALDAAEALSHAHAKGVVHRDLKPSNIILGEGGATVLDFGIARLLDTANTATALLIGTPAYFAPEGLQSARVGPGADRYALGIILFEMLTGQKPFSGENPFHVLEQHRNTPLPNLLALRPDTPPRLLRLVERLCQKEPAERPEDLEVQDILRTLKASHPL